uniref:Transmembrane protein 70 homolog, mitochondrial n=1 Tax=Strigamia maritima TaxID=126957 RepID=T1JLB4_STRMM
MKWCAIVGGCKFLPLRQLMSASLLKRSVSVSVLPLQTKQKLQNVSRDSLSSRPSTVQVYEGLLTRMVKGIKIFSFSTSFLGLMCQPVLVSKSLATSSIIIGSVGGFIAVYSILTPIILHWIVRRYVVQLYFDSNTKSFTSVTLGFFNTQKKLEFSACDVSVPEVESPLTTFIVKGKPLLVDPQQFTDLSIYGHLMGYDKPIDLQLEKKQSTEENK